MQETGAGKGPPALQEDAEQSSWELGAGSGRGVRSVACGLCPIWLGKGWHSDNVRARDCSLAGR